VTRLSALVDNARVAFTAGKLTWQAAMAAQHDALVAAAQSPGSRNIYPIEYYTPESPSPGSPVGAVTLTNSNIADAIRAAVAAAQAANGGVIQIPPGAWIVGDEEIEIVCSNDRDNCIVIRGAGMDNCSLNFPDAYTGTAIKFTPAGGGSCFNVGVEDITIQCITAASHNTGTGLHIEACVNGQFRNVTIRNFLGGTGFKTRKVGVDQTNQYCQLHNFTVAGCNVNYDVKSLINSQGYGVYSSVGNTRDYLLDDVKWSIYGGNTQTSAPIACELAGEGNCRFVIYDYYWEGSNPATVMFKLNSPSGSYNQVDIYGFHLGGGPAIFVDTDFGNNVTLRNIYGAGNASTIVKARSGAPVSLQDTASIVDSPSKFDLDAASRAVLSCTGYSETQFAGGKSVSEKGFTLSGYATGSEPSSPSTGDLVRDSTADRPTYRNGSSAWKRVAFVDDDNSLTALLAPHCVEIWDPRVFKNRSVIAGEIDTLTGVLNGTVLSAPASSQRPTWNSTDEVFGNRPSFSCAFTGTRYLSGTLATTIAAGSRPGLLAVFRCLPSTLDANRRIAVGIEHGANHSSTHAIGMTDLNVATAPYGYLTGVFLTGAALLDAYGHAVLTYSDSVGRLNVDLATQVTGTDPGVTSSIIDTAQIGAAWTGAAYAGCNATVAYCAVLKEALDVDTQARVIKLAMSQYGLRGL
jgi:hypothetical protein